VDSGLQPSTESPYAGAQPGMCLAALLQILSIALIYLPYSCRVEEFALSQGYLMQS